MQNSDFKEQALTKKRRKFLIRRIIFFLCLIIALILFMNFMLSLLVKEDSYRGIYKKSISERELKEMEKSLNIREVKYNWAEGLKEGNMPKRLIIHHSATENEESPEEIHKFHLEKGWSGIGYHFYIRKDGTIYRGRDENFIGSHAKTANYNTLGICLEGNFEKEGLKEEQKKSLINLGFYLSLKYPIKDILPHRDVVDTLCPGSLFPLETIKNEIINYIKYF